MQNEKISYAQAMEQIEKILARLRNEQMDIDTLADQVKEATCLISNCKERLLKAEQEVKKILK